MRGGKRRGAGRPKGATSKVPTERPALQAFFDEQAVKRFAHMLEHYFRRGQGKKTTADPRVLIDFLNRTLGKPIDAVQISGEGAPLAVRIVHQQVKE